jgi:hypothetical protein
MTSSVVPTCVWRIWPSAVVDTIAVLFPLRSHRSPKKHSGSSAIAQMGMMSEVVLVPV